MDVDEPRARARITARLVGLLVGLIVVSSCSTGPAPSAEAGSAESIAQPGPSAPSAPAAQGQRYSDGRNGFSIVPPAQWRPRPKPEANPVVTFYRLPPDTAGGAPFPVNIVVYISGTTDGLDENVAAARQQLPETLADYRPTTDERAQLADGTPAQLLGGTYTGQGMALRNIQLVVVLDGSSYVATATAPAVSFENYQDVLRGSLLTLIPHNG